MKKILFVVLIFISMLLIYGCATFKAIKGEYKKNRQGDMNVSNEFVIVGKALEKDIFHSLETIATPLKIVVIPIEKIFVGNKIYEDKSRESKEEK